MLVLVTDNVGENVNTMMRETLHHLNIHHINISVLHPQSNSKVERSHRSLNNFLSKRMDDNQCKLWHIEGTLILLGFIK